MGGLNIKGCGKIISLVVFHRSPHPKGRVLRPCFRCLRFMLTSSTIILAKACFLPRRQQGKKRETERKLNGNLGDKPVANSRRSREPNKQQLRKSSKQLQRSVALLGLFLRAPFSICCLLPNCLAHYQKEDP